MDEKWLAAIWQGRSVVAEEPVDVIAAGADLERFARNRDCETCIVLGAAERSDDVNGFGLANVFVNDALFVPVRVQCYAALLFEDRRVMLVRFESKPAEIASHILLASFEFVSASDQVRA